MNKRTNSGRRFYTEEEMKQVKRPKTHEEILREVFAKKCGSYGLSPSFYRAAAVNEYGEKYELIGFDENFAVFEDEGNAKRVENFREAVRLMQEALRIDISEIEAKLELLGYAGKRKERALEEASREIEIQRRNLTNALNVFNGAMDSVVESMNLPKEALYAGVDFAGNLYEFVSYRDEDYIIENLDVSEEDTDRFLRVSFETLIEGLMTHANAENNTYLMHALAAAVPAERWEVNAWADTGDSDAVNVSPFEFTQMKLF